MFRGRAVRPGEQETMGDESVLARARGCLFGQVAGDSLGGLVEFSTPDRIRQLYPEGVRELRDGGVWGTLAGQPTDDSELALMLARTLSELGRFDVDAVRRAYRYWYESGPFDCGSTIAAGLCGTPKHSSEANGALMRVSPLGVFGVRHAPEEVARWAEEDAAITHPNPVCRGCSAVFSIAILGAIRGGESPQYVYDFAREWAEKLKVADSIRRALDAARTTRPEDYLTHQGWVLIALQNAFWQLLHAPGLEEAVVDTLHRGGDTDTNAAICGALLGAVYGEEAVPDQWKQAILNCRPVAGDPRVRHPRPRPFWPIDLPELAAALVSGQPAPHLGIRALDPQAQL